MASVRNAQTQQNEKVIAYSASKEHYMLQLQKNIHLFKGNLCTRAAIDEKINEIYAKGSTSDFKIELHGGKPTLFIKGVVLYLQVLAVEEAFDFLLEMHNNSNHGSVSDMYELIKKKYHIPSVCASWVVEGCRECHSKTLQKPEPKIAVADICKKVTKTKNIVRGIWRMNIIKDSTLRQNPKSRARYLLIYREYNTQFLVLRPLLERSEEVALEIMKVFVEFGYPEMVYVPNILEFYKGIFQIVYAMYPVTRVPVGLAPNEIFEQDKQEVLMELKNWNENADNAYWEQNCHIIQYEINTSQRYVTEEESGEKTVMVPFNLFFNYESNKKIGSKPLINFNN